MTRIVVDTNVLVSAVIGPRSTPAKVLELWRQRAFKLVVSRSTINELTDVLNRPKILVRYSLDADQNARFVADLRESALVAADTRLTGIVPNDPRDDHVISAAVEAGADCIVTGDRHLLALGSYEGIPILTPAEFVDELRGA
jgi:putative PIN family toxin of toxin-antitoxin system